MAPPADARLQLEAVRLTALYGRHAVVKDVSLLFPAHTVTAVDGSFDSGNLDPSEGFSWFFDQPGTFPYTCSLHAWMTGTIVVVDGDG